MLPPGGLVEPSRLILDSSVIIQACHRLPHIANSTLKTQKHCKNVAFSTRLWFRDPTGQLVSTRTLLITHRQTCHLHGMVDRYIFQILPTGFSKRHTDFENFLFLGRQVIIFFGLTWSQSSHWAELEAGGKPSTRLPPEDSYSLYRSPKREAGDLDCVAKHDERLWDACGDQYGFSRTRYCQFLSWKSTRGYTSPLAVTWLTVYRQLQFDREKIATIRALEDYSRRTYLFQ